MFVKATGLHKGSIMEEVFCSTCQGMKMMAMIQQKEEIEIDGKKIVYNMEFFRCPDCGEDFEEMEQLDRNLKAAREAYDSI